MISYVYGISAIIDHFKPIAWFAGQKVRLYQELLAAVPLPNTFGVIQRSRYSPRKRGH
jgi:hypothetical protein